ncbi:MAG: c-type cytochrome [Bryobacteraceae bacterium]
MTWSIPLFLALQLQMELPNADKNPYTSAADLEEGKALFAGRCAGCHGPKGDGGKGADLGVPMLPRASTDLALYRVVRYGIPDTEMPQTLLSTKEVWQIAAFVRSLGQVKRDKVAGDVSNGERLVRAKGSCLQCHMLGMQGGLLGPSLTDVASRRSPSYLRSKLTDPGADLPETYRVADLTTKQGRKVSGVRLNEDTWTIQVRDAAGRIHSLSKDDLSQRKVERRTLMPSYRARPASELDDMVAYLSTLRGDK